MRASAACARALCLALVCAGIAQGLPDPQPLALSMVLRDPAGVLGTTYDIQPINRFPSQHPLVTHGFCGGVGALDLIPEGTADCTNCRWDKRGKLDFAQCASTTVCLNTCDPADTACVPYGDCRAEGYMHAGGLFYAYNQPNPGSANTGYERPNHAVMTLVQDTAEQVWLLFTIGSPSASSSASIGFIIQGEGVGATTAYIALTDDYRTVGTDPAVCATSTSDCFAWDHATTKGAVYLRKPNSARTDGFVVGPFVGDFAFDIALSDLVNVDGFVFSERLQDDGTVTQREFSTSQAFAGFRVESRGYSSSSASVTPSPSRSPVVAPSSSATPTPAVSPSASASRSRSSSPSPSPTVTPTMTPTMTPTPTPSPTPSRTPSLSRSATASASASASASATASVSVSPSASSTASASRSPTRTPSRTTTPSSSPSPSSTATPSPSSSASPSASSSATPTPTPSPSPSTTVSPSLSASMSLSLSSTASPSPSSTVSTSLSPTASPSLSSTASATATSTRSPSPSSTPTPTATPSRTRSASVSSSSSASLTPTPSVSPTSSVSPSPSTSVSATPSPSLCPHFAVSDELEAAASSSSTTSSEENTVVNSDIQIVEAEVGVELETDDSAEALQEGTRAIANFLRCVPSSSLESEITTTEPTSKTNPNPKTPKTPKTPKATTRVVSARVFVPVGALREMDKISLVLRSPLAPSAVVHTLHVTPTCPGFSLDDEWVVTEGEFVAVGVTPEMLQNQTVVNSMLRAFLNLACARPSSYELRHVAHPGSNTESVQILTITFTATVPATRAPLLQDDTAVTDAIGRPLSDATGAPVQLTVGSSSRFTKAGVDGFTLSTIISLLSLVASSVFAVHSVRKRRIAANEKRTQQAKALRAMLWLDKRRTGLVSADVLVERAGLQPTVAAAFVARVHKLSPSRSVAPEEVSLEQLSSVVFGDGGKHDRLVGFVVAKVVTAFSDWEVANGDKLAEAARNAEARAKDQSRQAAQQQLAQARTKQAGRRARRAARKASKKVDKDDPLGLGRAYELTAGFVAAAVTSGHHTSAARAAGQPKEEKLAGEGVGLLSAAAAAAMQPSAQPPAQYTPQPASPRPSPSEPLSPPPPPPPPSSHSSLLSFNSENSEGEGGGRGGRRGSNSSSQHLADGEGRRRSSVLNVAALPNDNDKDKDKDGVDRAAVQRVAGLASGGSFNSRRSSVSSHLRMMGGRQASGQVSGGESGASNCGGDPDDNDNSSDSSDERDDRRASVVVAAGEGEGEGEGPNEPLVRSSSPGTGLKRAGSAGKRPPVMPLARGRSSQKFNRHPSNNRLRHMGSSRRPADLMRGVSSLSQVSQLSVDSGENDNNDDAAVFAAIGEEEEWQLASGRVHEYAHGRPKASGRGARDQSSSGKPKSSERKRTDVDDGMSLAAVEAALAEIEQERNDSACSAQSAHTVLEDFDDSNPGLQQQGGEGGEGGEGVDRRYKRRQRRGSAEPNLVEDKVRRRANKQQQQQQQRDPSPSSRRVSYGRRLEGEAPLFNEIEGGRERLRQVDADADRAPVQAPQVQTLSKRRLRRVFLVLAQHPEVGPEVRKLYTHVIGLLQSSQREEVEAAEFVNLVLEAVAALNLDDESAAQAMQTIIDMIVNW